MNPIRALSNMFLRLLVSIDVSLGILIYSLSTLFTHQKFDVVFFLITVMATLAPDLDMLPFLFIGKKLKYPSHRQIGHHPLLIIPFFMFAGWLVAGAWFTNKRFYLVSILGVAVTAHFIHDSCSPIGLHWFSPFSWKYFTLSKGFPQEVPNDFINEFFITKNKKKRNWIEQITSRVDKISISRVVFFLLAVLILAMCRFS